MAYGKLKVDRIETTAEELTLPTSAGSSGQVLTSDGSGVLSFQDNATGCNLTATASDASLTVESSSGTNVQLPAASPTAWGVMTDEDKSKLDLIEPSANNYVISADLLDEDAFTSDSATKVASQQSIKAYVDTELAELVDSSPASLDTLNELAAALGDDSNYAATITTSLGLKAPKASPAFTGDATCTGTISDAKGDVRSIPLNDQSSSATYVAATSDAGKSIQATGTTQTVELSGSTGFSAGDAVTILNGDSTTLNITATNSLSLRHSVDAATGNRALAQYGMATVYFTSATVAYISGAGLS